MFRLFVSGIVAAAFVVLTTPVPASGMTFDKLAYLTFSAPVQIPGATLNAGTYRFHLTNAETSRNVVQVLSNDGAIVFAMFNTRPDSRTKLTGDAVVTFMETPAGVPVAVRSLFYGNEYRGYEFVYGKGEPNMIPPVVRQPEITYTATPAPAWEPVIEPEVEPVAPVEAVPEVEPVPEPQPVELPRTASPVPFFAVGGLATLLAGLGLGLLRRRVG